MGEKKQEDMAMLERVISEVMQWMTGRDIKDLKDILYSVLVQYDGYKYPE